MSDSTWLVELRGVGKAFGAQQVLRGLELSVARGESVCLSGPSGCGKTTVLELVAGSLAPDRGLRRVHAARVGYMFQDDCLIPWRNCLENVAFALAGTEEPEVARRRAAEWLARVGLADAAEKRPSELSGGMRRRVNLARGLAVEPDLLLLDEPLAFQDAETSRRLLEAIAADRLARGTAILAVSHEPESLSSLGCRLLELRDGQTVDVG